MFRALSPISDTPEGNLVRRVKPLPKRRRTSEPTHNDAGGDSGVSAVPPHFDAAAADELLAQADALTAQMALQAYYMPVLGGVQELVRAGLVAPTSTPIDLGGSTFGLADLRSAHDEGADDGDGDGDTEGDYGDHLQQPGNTKKRKVPVNMAGAPHGPDMAGMGEDEAAERGVPSGGRLERDYDAIDVHPSASPGAGLQKKKERLPRATWVGLQHKELLKSRKRQLAAVVGALSHGDTLALDQALSSSYPFVRAGLSVAPPLRFRPSRRWGARLARAHKAYDVSLPSLSSPAAHIVDGLPETDFEFLYSSATSDRLVATREEVAILHTRFEAELVRQAAKAAEAAKQAAAAVNGPLGKRAGRSKQRRAVKGGGTDAKTGSPDQSLLDTKEHGGKKKKRSALANASNPHHLRNYVPSRLPHSGQANTTQAVQNAQNLLSPLPLRFLSADLPPRRRKKAEAVAALTNPTEEWICPFCEYSLFYGDDAGFQRAVRNRKKILRRRRRARERAAAAASGVAATKPAEKDIPASEDARFAEPDASYVGEGIGANSRQAKWKDERDRGGQAITDPALG